MKVDRSMQLVNGNKKNLSHDNREQISTTGKIYDKTSACKVGINLTSVRFNKEAIASADLICLIWTNS